MLPGIDGFEVATELRKRGQYVPVLMLTARGAPEDVLQGFEAGADDYLPKPFDSTSSSRESADCCAAPSGSEAHGRRARAPRRGRRLHVRRPHDRLRRLEVQNGDERLQLTVMEAKLLSYLIQHEDRIVSRKAMLEEVWGVHEDTDTRAIDNFIVRLRRYIEDDPTRLATCRRFAASATVRQRVA